MSKKYYKSDLAVGNFEFKNQNFSKAMYKYINTLKHESELIKIIAINIYLTGRHYQKAEINSKIIINTEIKINDSKKSEITLGSKIINEGLENFSPEECQILLNNLEGIKIHKNDIAESIPFYIAQNPSKVVYIWGNNSLDILIGIMYKLIWNSEVKIYTNKELGYVNLKNHINNHAKPASICAMVIYAQGLCRLILKAMSNNDGLNDKKEKVWPKSHQILNAIDEKLNSSEYEVFLENLFQMVIGRKIQKHEFDHYLSELKNNNSSRIDILSAVIEGEESKRYLDGKSLNSIIQIKYQIPIANEINPWEIKIPLHDDPLVSILIPIYGKLEYTLSCLYSIAENLPKCSFEILILDDRSPDNSVIELKKIKNIKIIENPENYGFLKSCNHGVGYAKGEYLLFLNNDTNVRYGWLDELLLTFKNFPGCGLAGSKLIFPDGKLQEAGGIIWNDGSAWNYGRGDDPNNIEYNYAREVDYCSGAAILIPRKLFIELGYFDERYIPAYCEDSDIALNIRDAGYRVIYQPKSEIIHFEGVSSGTDINIGVKAYQVKNSKKQYQKWKHVLEVHRPNGHQSMLERDRNTGGRILFIDASTPTPDKDSGSIDIFNLMIMFRELGYFVAFMPEDNFAYLDTYTDELQKNGVYTLYRPYCNSIEDHLRIYGEYYDLVMIFRPDIAMRTINIVRSYCKKAKVIFNTVDLHFLRLERQAKLLGDANIAKQAENYKKIEFNLFKKADISTIISSYEFDIIKEIDSNINLFYLPFSRGVAEKVNSFDSRNGIIFVGGFQHPPNLDAINYFVNEIFPVILERDPNIILHIVGSNCPDEVNKMNSNNIIVHGYLQNLSELLQSVRVNIVPLRYGAGIKGKLGGALAVGLPSVSTPLGAEGMELNEIHSGVMIASDPNSFAEHILKIHNDKEYWDNLSKNALNFAEVSFGASKLHENLRILLSKFNINISPLKKHINLL